jgi:hypothetical protein
MIKTPGSARKEGTPNKKIAAPPSSPTCRARSANYPPGGLSFLFATEMWQRFSYYGMRALLVLYLVEYVIQPGTAGQLIGLAALKRILEGPLGPLDIQPLASNIYGIYTGLVYLTPIFGGIIADRVLGHHCTIIIRCFHDGDRPFHDGVRATAAVRAFVLHSRQWPQSNAIL